MFNLLKANFKRVLKDKSFKVLIIIHIVFSFMNAISYYFLRNYANLIDFNTFFSSSFSISNNIALIIPILIIMFIIKDKTYGTRRNKLIVGHKRVHIYLVDLITALVVGLAFYILNGLTNLVLLLTILDYSQTIVITYILRCFVLSCLIYSTVLSISVLFSYIFKSSGISILVYIGFIFGALILSALISLAGYYFTDLADIFDFINKLNVMNHISLVTENTSSVDSLTTILVSNVLYIIGLNAIGIFVFIKTDEK